MTSRPTLAFGDDDSPACDVCWLWINNHPWPGWNLEVITAQVGTLEPPGAEDAALHAWYPSNPRQPFTETAFADVEHLTAKLDPRLALSTRQADLLVIGPRGPGLLKRLHLGTTAEWLLQHPVAPLVIVRSGHPVRDVIACHDGSPHAQLAVECLAKLPWIGNARVTILTVDDGRADIVGAAEMAQRELETVNVTPKFLALQDKTTAAILGEIEQRRPDLVALGTRGLTGFQRFHVGSTAAAVARAAPSSVLVACFNPETEDNVVGGQ